MAAPAPLVYKKEEVFGFPVALKSFGLLWDFSVQGGAIGIYRTNLIIPDTCIIITQLVKVVQTAAIDGEGNGSFEVGTQDPVFIYSDNLNGQNSYEAVTDDKAKGCTIRGNGKPVTLSIKDNAFVSGKILFSFICYDANTI